MIHKQHAAANFNLTDPLSRQIAADYFADRGEVQTEEWLRKLRQWPEPVEADDIFNTITRELGPIRLSNYSGAISRWPAMRHFIRQDYLALSNGPYAITRDNTSIEWRHAVNQQIVTRENLMMMSPFELVDAALMRRRTLIGGLLWFMEDEFYNIFGPAADPRMYRMHALRGFFFREAVMPRFPGQFNHVAVFIDATYCYECLDRKRDRA